MTSPNLPSTQFIVGLTGGIGSGKSSVSALFEEKGIKVVDADIIAREVVTVGSPLLTEIAKHFGDKVINEDGSINRAQLREIVFSNPDEKTKLNQLMHPVIRKHIVDALSSAQSAYVILSAPLLFENNLDAITHRDLVVDVPEHIQIERTSARDKVNQTQVESIIKAQISRNERLEKADDIIDNSGPQSFLNKQVDELHAKYLELARAIK
ncbi:MULTISPECIES: dephospho-CoA kinase [Gammaproteobacteria]|uniref:dephospho-CoA kinase n=1 Tax=Gammaproteobacteria TaxID=1236 RepID=UPI000DCF9B05|nr:MULTISPECIES: dephospho-CoA kinase [Gammaproteobacteria]RTE86308.1 dephospho-CoA kinase [Aliidiomarina sp. B3213]TCZ91658.1 dephospho-CoA kinase [Lysobacter sp. N42]